MALRRALDKSLLSSICMSKYMCPHMSPDICTDIKGKSYVPCPELRSPPGLKRTTQLNILHCKRREATTAKGSMCF